MMPAVVALDTSVISIGEIVIDNDAIGSRYGYNRDKATVNTYEHCKENEGANVVNEVSKDELIVSNMGLVDMAVNKLNVHKNLVDDAKSEGYLALVKAAKKYDTELGVQFSTFAYHCISGAIKNMMTYGKAICYPAEISRKSSKVKKYIASRNLESVTSLTDGDWLDLGIGDVDTINSVKQCMNDVLSTDITVTNDDGDESSFEIIDERAYVDESVIKRDNLELILEHIDNQYGRTDKGYKKANVLKYLVISIAEGRNETMEEIGKRLDVRKQTVYKYLSELKNDEALKDLILEIM